MSIYDEVLSFINRPRAESFDSLALAVFRYQFENVPLYRRFCVARGVAPETVTHLSQIPAAGTVAFKYAEIRGPAADVSPSALTFTTSGTTKGFTERGRHLVPRPEIYRASAIAHLRRMLFPDRRRLAMLALHPTADRIPESSLSTMLSWCIEDFGTSATMCAATRERVDTAAAIEFLDARQSRGEPVCILGTTAASAALFAAIDQLGQTLALPADSRLMDTGGAKGQAIPLTPIEVVERAHQTLGIAPAMVINEYGMTEMCSQLYDATPFNTAPWLSSSAPPSNPGAALINSAPAPFSSDATPFNPGLDSHPGGRCAYPSGRASHHGSLLNPASHANPAPQPSPIGYRVKLAPPWLRPTVLDPVTLNPVDEGRIGLLAFFDLANVGSISALMTEDFGMVQSGAVTILGRAAAGGARGCALSIDEFARRELAAQSGLVR